MKKVKKMAGVNKLQLVDGNKLAAVLELIKKDIETKQMLASLEKPDNFIFEEKKMQWKKIIIKKKKKDEEKEKKILQKFRVD